MITRTHPKEGPKDYKNTSEWLMDIWKDKSKEELQEIWQKELQRHKDYRKFWSERGEKLAEELENEEVSKLVNQVIFQIYQWTKGLASSRYALKQLGAFDD